MRTMLACVSAVVLGLTTAPSISAQTGDNDAARKGRQRAGNSQDAGNQQTVRGVIAGINVVGEMAIDYRTNRAVAVEASTITVVGSSRPGAMNAMGAPANRDQDRRDRAEQGRANRGEGRDADRDDNQGASDRPRENLYVLSITPRTEVYEAPGPGRPQGGGDRSNPAARRDRDDASPAASGDREGAKTARDRDGEAPARDRDQANRGAARGPRRGSPSSFEALEIGDRVLVTFTGRPEATSTGRDAQPGADGDQRADGMNRRHGRHRTYFGEAVSITILPGAPQRALGSDRAAPRPSALGNDRTPDRDDQARDRARDNDERDRAKAQEARDRARDNDERDRAKAQEARDRARDNDERDRVKAKQERDRARDNEERDRPKAQEDPGKAEDKQP